jgi:hypothetical protein
MKLSKSVVNNRIWSTEIAKSLSSIQNANTGAQGDCLYLSSVSKISTRTIFDSTDDKNKHSESLLSLEYISDSCHRSNLASGEPEHHEIGFPTSSATFIVSSSQMKIQQEDNKCQNMTHSDTSRMLSEPVDINSIVCIDKQAQIWFKQHWISITVITGMIVIFITIITIAIIL